MSAVFIFVYANLSNVSNAATISDVVNTFATTLSGK